MADQLPDWLWFLGIALAIFFAGACFYLAIRSDD